MPTARSPDEDRTRGGLLRRLRSQRVLVHDESMRPALEPGDRLLVDRQVLKVRAPRVGEIVVLTDPAAPDRWLIKRVATVDPGSSSVEVRGDASERARDSRQFGPVPLAFDFAVPGVTTRALFAWALGTGMPMLGVVGIGILALTGDRFDGHDFQVWSLPEILEALRPRLLGLEALKRERRQFDPFRGRGESSARRSS